MTYIEDARAKAKRRKSPWNLLVLVAAFASWMAVYFLTLKGIDLLHQYIHPGQSLATAKGGAVFVASLSPLFGALPVGFIIANIIVWQIPAARRVLETEARPFIGADFFSSQRGLMKVASIVTPLTLLLAVIGAFLSW